jgi:hypothetical protein
MSGSPSQRPLASPEGPLSLPDAESRLELTGFLVSFVVHVAILLLLAMTLLPEERRVDAVTILSEPPIADLVEDAEVVMPLPEPEEQPVGKADAIAVTPSVEDEVTLAGAFDVQPTESLLAADFVDDISLSTIPDADSLFGAFGQGRQGNGLDAAGLGGTVKFYGIKAAGRRFVFVTDCSGSMQGDRLQRLKEELRESISMLNPRVEFFIIFFNDIAEPMPSRRCVKATPKLIEQYLEWADSVPSSGGTDPSEAMAIALRLRPSAVFLLTDGVFDSGSTLDVIKQLNKGRRTQINTIAFGERGSEAVLREIAEQNKGTYRYVDE